MKILFPRKQLSEMLKSTITVTPTLDNHLVSTQIYNNIGVNTAGGDLEDWKSSIENLDDPYVEVTDVLIGNPFELTTASDNYPQNIVNLDSVSTQSSIKNTKELTTAAAVIVEQSEPDIETTSENTEPLANDINKSQKNETLLGDVAQLEEITESEFKAEPKIELIASIETETFATTVTPQPTNVLIDIMPDAAVLTTQKSIEDESLAETIINSLTTESDIPDTLNLMPNQDDTLEMQLITENNFNIEAHTEDLPFTTSTEFITEPETNTLLSSTTSLSTTAQSQLLKLLLPQSAIDLTTIPISTTKSTVRPVKLSITTKSPSTVTIPENKLTRIILNPSTKNPMPKHKFGNNHKHSRNAVINHPLLKLQNPIFNQKKNIKRAAQMDNGVVTPSPRYNNARRTWMERRQSETSVERAERHSATVEKLMHAVSICGHVDGYLTSRMKTGVQTLSKMFNAHEA